MRFSNSPSAAHPPRTQRSDRLRALGLVAVFASWGFGAQAFDDRARGGADETVRYVPLPAQVTRDKVFYPDEQLRERLHRWTLLALSDRQPRALTSAGTRHPNAGPEDSDRVVVFTDGEGLAILPDMESAQTVRSPPLASTLMSTPSKAIAFSFNSPRSPWTEREIAVLEKTVGDCYPLVKEIYGDPAFDLTVNISKDPYSPYAGLYYTTLNEIVVRAADSADVICHEIIHAFRDDNLIGLTSFEEGMTRAAEVEVFGRLGSYEYWNKYHSYTYDVYYEGLSRPKIGARNGGFFSGYIAPLIRYQTSGYAWGKALLENRRFLVNFNAELYRRTAENAATPNMEDRLIEIGAAVQPRVEGQAFARWYRRQGILRTDPGSGYFLYHRVNQWTVDYFYRDDTGRETMQTGKEVTWSVYDHLNRPLDQGSGKTSAAGWFDFQPVLPDGYRGRVKVVLSSDSPLGEVSDISFRYAGSESGVFGIVRGANRGRLNITPLARRSAAVVLNVTNGGFCAPTLGRFRGRFEAVFVNKDGRVSRVKFNKDRSNYFLKIP